jgi:beta-xylosidase
MESQTVRRCWHIGLIFLFCVHNIEAQTKYQNPVIPFDYSDPDVIRVQKDYYLIASSFNHVPGLPILHSTDLIHWQLISYALPKLLPVEQFQAPVHGGGIWAPSIRYRRDTFYIYYPDPDRGIYRIHTTDIRGKWSEPSLVMAGKGLIDPCPFWDENGNAYLAFALAGSRAGMKSMLFIQQLNPQGDAGIGSPVLVYDGHAQDATIEGPKMYQRNGYYYLFAPAGGVSTGWQLVLRSKSVFGPYERKVVLQQGSTTVNGPHQGAWVTTPKGEDWFLHFQDRDAFGRIVHLQPMSWNADWPVMGRDLNGDGIGEPVMEYRNPDGQSLKAPDYSVRENFTGSHLSLDWQWQANQSFPPAFPYLNQLLFFARPWPMSEKRNLWMLPDMLLRKIVAGPSLMQSTIDFSQIKLGETGGFILFGLDYQWVGVTRDSAGLVLQLGVCLQADKGHPEKMINLVRLTGSSVKIMMQVDDRARVLFSYQEPGKASQSIPEPFQAKPGKWVGAKVGYFMIRPSFTNDAGWMLVNDYASTSVVPK